MNTHRVRPSAPLAPDGTPARRGRISRPRLILIVVLAVVIVVVAGVGIRTWWTVRQVLPGGGITEPIGGRYTIALLGSDAADWRDGARVDSTTLVSVDAVTGRTLVISIPRNLTNIPFPETSPLHSLYPTGYVCPNQAQAPCMLTMVYQTGLDNADLYPGSPDPGAEATIDALEGITGLTVNYYAFIDMDGFEALVDAVGGIDLTIRERVAVGAMGQTMYWIDPGEHHFTGEEALWYIRTRVGTDDYTRMTREKCVLLSVIDQFGPTTLVTHFTDLTRTASKSAHTNIPAGQLPGLASLASKATTWTIYTLNLTPPLVDPLAPDFTQIHQEVTAAVAQVEALDDPNSQPSSSTLGATDLTTACGY